MSPTLPDLSDLAARLDSPDPSVRMVALAHLRSVPNEEAVPLILKVIDDANLQVRSLAIFGLGVKHSPQSLPTLLRILGTDTDYGIRADAAGALGYLGDVRAFESLVRAFYEDVEWLVRFSAAVSLGNLKDPRAYEVLARAIQSPDTLMHQAVIAAFGEIGDPRCLELILNFAQSEDWLVRQRLAQALGNLPGSRSESALKYLAKDPHESVSAAAQDSLQRLGHL